MAIKDYRLRSMLGPQGVAPRQYDYSFSQPTPQRRPSFDFDQTSPDVGDLGDVQQAPQKDNASRFYDEIARIRGQATPGETAYKQALGSMPTPDQYKPNWLTRIASGLSGFSAGMKDAGEGIKVAYGLNRAPYESAMEQYRGQLGGLKEQYNIESGDKDEQVKDLMAAASMGMKYDDYMLKKQIAENKFQTDQVTAGARSRTADAAVSRATAANRPKYTTPTPVQGGFMTVNEADPSDFKFIKANTIQEAMLHVSQMNAGSQRISAGASASQAATAEKRQGTYATAVGNTGRNIDSQIATRGAIVNNLQTPGAQKTARELAVDQLFDDPVWNEFVDGNPSDFDPKDWADYQAKVREVEQKILTTRKR